MKKCTNSYVMLISALIVVPSYAVDLDLTNSLCNVDSDNNILLRNVSVAGTEYWGTFKWDNTQNIFRLNKYGGEPIVFNDNFSDEFIDVQKWYTNGMGWYDATKSWSSDVKWTESGGVLNVQGTGDYIPIELVSDIPDNFTINFRILLGEWDNGGAAFISNPFSTPSLVDYLSFDVYHSAEGVTNKNNGIFIKRAINNNVIFNAHVFPNQIYSGVWYNVSISLFTDRGMTYLSYEVSGLGSGMISTTAINSTYSATLFARGANGVKANVSFDDISVTK